MSAATITLLFLLFAVVMFVFEKIPLGVTSMIVCIGLVVTGVLDVKTAFAGFIDSNVILFVAMFIVGGALFETGMANKIGGIVTHFAKSERSLIVAIMVIVGLMSGVLSNTGTAAVLIPVVIGIAAKSGYARSKLLMPLVFAAAMGGNLSLIGAPGNLIAQSALGEIGMSFGFFEYAIVGLPILAVGILFYATLGMKLLPNHPVSEDDSFSGEQDFSNPSMACANIATQMTFLGQGASNMAWNDVMMQAGAPTPLHIWDFTIARIPMLTIAILYMTFVGYKLMPDIPNEQFSDAAHTASESEKLSPFKRKLAVLIVLVSIAMMLLENVIGVKMYLTSCIGAAALVLTGVLTEKEALNSIHQPTIFLFAGVLALSDAIQTTGAGDVVADWMIRLLGDTTNPYIIMLVFFLVPFILTQVMSNLATLTIFIPLVTSACIRMGVDPRAAVVGVITASCVSIMTPMAAPCQIMIIEPGGYTLKDYLKCGTPLALILIVVSVFFLPTLYPFA